MMRRVFENQRLSKNIADQTFLPKFENIPGEKFKVNRLIFHNSTFLDYELQLIDFLQNKMMNKNIQIPKGCDDGTLLRFINSSYYDLEKTCESLKKYFLWLEKNKEKQISEKALIYFQSNFISYLGRDKMNKPIILFDLKKLEIKKGIQDSLVEALEILFINVKKYLFYPGVVEKMNIVIDLTGMDYITSDSFDFSFNEVIEKIIEISENFPETLEKTYLINPTRDFANIYWKPLERKKLIPKSFKEKSYAFSGNIDQKIPGFSLKLLPLKQLTEYIDPSYIPEVYGGKAKEFPNLLSGINKKPSNDDFMIDFENLIKEMQFLEIEREKKHILKEQMKEEILKSKEELQRFMEAMIAENEILKKKIEKNN